MEQDAKFVAEVRSVREVALLGRSKPEYWRQALEGTGLEPVAENGFVKVLISGARLQWLWIRFAEVSFCVEAAHPELGRGWLLIQAVNSSALLNWCENRLFQTPYIHADCSVALEPHVGICVRASGDDVLRATKRSGNSGSAVEADWRGRIYLPSSTKARVRYFTAELTGNCRSFAFHSNDELHWTSASALPVLDALRASGFGPAEWRVREDAIHKRSKTLEWTT